MAHTFFDNGTTHSTTLTGLSGDLTPSVFFVQCAAYAAGPPLVLAYRALPDSGSAPFPRLGNLWGNGNFRGHPEGLAYAASRASLWLGADWSAAEIAQLRALNPYTLVTTSINACETNDETLPDDFYLTNITQPPSTKGRLQSWPGAWRLDLTNPAVQAYQATLMACLVVYGGNGYGPDPGCPSAPVPPLVYDGLFVDNVFMDDGAAVNSHDIFGNPFYPLDRATGKVMVDFNERWRSGMTAEISMFRESAPHAILTGHAMDITDANISAQFNAISLGFITPQIIEGLQTFASGFQTYDAWMTQPARLPKVTMVESAVRLQLGYGYGFNGDLGTLITHDCENSNSIPGAPPPGNGNACFPTQPQKPGYILPQTFMLARSEYRYFRFGLGFTLMRDGVFTHELGDSWHGQDWDYDELHFRLGAPLGNATLAPLLNPAPSPVPPAIILAGGWSLWVRNPNGSNASLTIDGAVRPPGVPGAPPSARVDVQGSASPSDGIDLSQVVADFQAGSYAFSFWARASVDGVPVTLNARKDGGDWHNFGLDTAVTFGAAWALYNVTFPATPDGTPARLSWFLGAAPPGASVWVNSPALIGVPTTRPVLIRQFECGVVVLNGDTAQNTVLLPGGGAGLSRLSGLQAPVWQAFVDDASAAFRPLSGAWAVGTFDSGYDPSQPTAEEVRPADGFYHHWEAGAHAAAAPAGAAFDLGVPAPGAYNVSMWWPAAVPARAGWAQAARVTVVTPGQPNASVTLDLSSQGGDVFFPVALGVELGPGSTLVLECPAGGGTCIADALLVESAARWNDGSAAGAQLSLQPFDAIVLNRTQGAPVSCVASKN